MIASVIPSFGTYVYLENGDDKKLKKDLVLEGRLLGYEGSFHSPISLSIKKFKNDPDVVRYTCDKELRSIISFDPQLYERILEDIDLQGKANISYKNQMGVYKMIISDVLKLKKFKDVDAFTLYQTIQQSVFHKDYVKD